jgi:hypothetical protein
VDDFNSNPVDFLNPAGAKLSGIYPIANPNGGSSTGTYDSGPYPLQTYTT